ncbi:MAG: tryptophan-rich sensory protein, partial [Rikenellaceae bacterium]|nr:tryptophan-rich sensory protein [Rikenellaceae bacterium]
MKKFIAYPIAIAVCLAVGYLSSLMQVDALREWYPTVVKSPLSPPNMVFPIVWTALYILMGLSLGECFRTDNMRAVLPWVLQLIANFLWTLFFFRLRDPLLGLVDLLLLIVLTIWYMSSASRTSSGAGWLM